MLKGKPGEGSIPLTTAIFRLSRGVIGSTSDFESEGPMADVGSNPTETTNLLPDDVMAA